MFVCTLAGFAGSVSGRGSALQLNRLVALTVEAKPADHVGT